MRPDTTAGMFRQVAYWLDVYDRAMEAGIIRLGHWKPLATVAGKTLQSDLLLLAVWLEEHPDIDRRMYAVVDATEGI